MLLHSYIFGNMNKYYNNPVKQRPLAQLLPTKLVSSSFMYELKEYHNQIRLRIVCMESHLIIGQMLLQPYIYGNMNKYYNNPVKQQPVARLLPTKLVCSSFMYELREYHNQIWLQSVYIESHLIIGSNVAIILHIW